MFVKITNMTLERNFDIFNKYSMNMGEFIIYVNEKCTEKRIVELCKFLACEYLFRSNASNECMTNDKLVFDSCVGGDYLFLCACNLVLIHS